MRDINKAFTGCELHIQSRLRELINETPITEGNIDFITQLVNRYEFMQATNYSIAQQNLKAKEAVI